MLNKKEGFITWKKCLMLLLVLSLMLSYGLWWCKKQKQDHGIRTSSTNSKEEEIGKEIRLNLSFYAVFFCISPSVELYHFNNSMQAYEVFSTLTIDTSSNIQVSLVPSIWVWPQSRSLLTRIALIRVRKGEWVTLRTLWKMFTHPTHITYVRFWYMS